MRSGRHWPLLGFVEGRGSSRRQPIGSPLAPVRIEVCSCVTPPPPVHTRDPLEGRMSEERAEGAAPSCGSQTACHSQQTARFRDPTQLGPLVLPIAVRDAGQTGRSRWANPQPDMPQGTSTSKVIPPTSFLPSGVEPIPLRPSRRHPLSVERWVLSWFRNESSGPRASSRLPMDPSDWWRQDQVNRMADRFSPCPTGVPLCRLCLAGSREPRCERQTAPSQSSPREVE